MQLFTDKEYLLIDLANLAGFDKWTFDKRIQWAEENFQDFPMEEADKPYQFEAARKAFNRAVRYGRYDRPIGLDATASGASILGILEHCVDTARVTNLIDPMNRYDLYQEIADSFGFSREEVKKPVMTTLYSSTAEPKRLLGDRYSEFMDALYQVIPGAMEAFRSIESIHNPKVSRIEWVLPDGHTAYKIHREVKIFHIEHGEYSFKYMMPVECPTNNYRATCPDFIHSIDGWIAREVIRRCSFQVLPVHDCFYTLPKNLNDLRKVYLDILIELSEWDPSPALSSIAGEEVEWVREDNDFSNQIANANYHLS